MLVPVFLLDECKPVNGYVGHVCQVMVYALHLVLYSGNQLIGLVLVEFQYALHLYLHEPEDVVACNFSYEAGFEGREFLVHKGYGLVHVLGLLKSSFLIYAFLNEYFLKRSEEQLLHQLSAPYLQLLA